MIKRALIIGSQTHGLGGVNNDVRAIDVFINTLGFNNTVCIDGKATRQGILNEYEKLIKDSKAGDTAVIFYSGHGGLATNPHYETMKANGTPVPRYYQFIVPFDMDESTQSDFRGITSIELSALLSRLTQKTKNVTVILDCCHSARMSRDLALMPKALSKSWFLGIEAHLEKLAMQGISTVELDIESNPDAVRLVAASATQSAYEYTNKSGNRTGILTESLLMTLQEARGQQVSWQTIGTRIRERVLSMIPVQRPEIEGPTNRLLFELETIDRAGVLPVIFRDDIPMLQGGRLMGVTVGDKYSIVPMGVERPTSQNELAIATVSEVSGSVSAIAIDYVQDSHKKISAGANAFPISTVLPKHPVKISGPQSKVEQMKKAIERSERLRVVTNEIDEGLLAQVAILDDKIDLMDRSDSYSLIAQKPFSEAAIAETTHNLNLYARVQSLLNLESGKGENALNTPIELEFGRVVNGLPQQLNGRHDVLATGDHVYLKVANNGSKNIYVSVFDIGLSGKISLLTRSEPSGVEILPGQEYVLGYREGVGLQGLELGWAQGVPEDGPREESFLAIITDVPQDLRPLQGQGMRAFGEKLSPLQQMMDQIGLGGTRDVVDDDIPDVRYIVQRINFLLSPTPLTIQDDSQFLIDNRPPKSLLYLSPRSIEKPPEAIAIRLKDLIVHSNRALFSTEIRIDNMIITAPTDGDEKSFYRVETAHFTNIKDGDRLPLDNMLVYHGPVAHFIDMAIWVSRDQRDSLSLAELINVELNSVEFKSAATALAALAVAAPQVALMIGAFGGAATLINISTKLLLQATGKSIGLYRTSHIASEKFGLGRHPYEGVMQAQDFSFSYEILPLS